MFGFLLTFLVFLFIGLPETSVFIRFHEFACDLLLDTFLFGDLGIVAACDHEPMLLKAYGWDVTPPQRYE